MASPNEEAPGRGAAVKSSLRTLEILELMSTADDDLSIAEVSRLLDIPKSSLHGIMRTMAARGWLATDQSGLRYRLGLKAALTSMSFLDRDLVVSVSRPALDAVAEATGETVHLGRLDDAEIVYLAKRESKHALRLYSAVGRRLPAHTTALGKAILANMTDEQVQRQLPASLPALTANTITSRAHLMGDLEATRERGYAIDNGENTEGIYCLAIALTAPAADYSAISCSVPKIRMTPDRIELVLGALRAAAAEVDDLLSHASRTQIVATSMTPR
jgi:DNA-binding IclR family transcriptional regulator